MATQALASLLSEGIKEHAGYELETYPKIYPKLFHERKTSGRYIQTQRYIPYKLPGDRDPGGVVTQGEILMDFGYRLVVRGFSLGDVVADEDLMDDLYGMLARWASSRGGSIARSYVTLEEREAATYFGTTGFTATSPAPGSPDGDSLFSTSHPTSAYDNVNQISNRPSAEVDLSMAALQAMRANLEQQMSNNGVTIQMNRLARIVVNPNIAEIAYQLAKGEWVSTSNAGNSDRSINTMKGAFDVVVWPYFRRTGATGGYAGSYNAWFGQGETHSMVWYDREALTFDQDKDANTRSTLFTSHRRFVLGHEDFRGMYGSLGL